MAERSTSTGHDACNAAYADNIREVEGAWRRCQDAIDASHGTDIKAKLIASACSEPVAATCTPRLGMTDMSMTFGHKGEDLFIDN